MRFLFSVLPDLIFVRRQYRRRRRYRTAWMKDRPPQRCTKAASDSDFATFGYEVAALVSEPRHDVADAAVHIGRLPGIFMNKFGKIQIMLIPGHDVQPVIRI